MQDLINKLKVIELEEKKLSKTMKDIEIKKRNVNREMRKIEKKIAIQKMRKIKKEIAIQKMIDKKQKRKIKNEIAIQKMIDKNRKIIQKTITKGFLKKNNKINNIEKKVKAPEPKKLPQPQPPQPRPQPQPIPIQQDHEDIHDIDEVEYERRNIIEKNLNVIYDSEGLIKSFKTYPRNRFIIHDVVFNSVDNYMTLQELYMSIEETKFFRDRSFHEGLLNSVRIYIPSGLRLGNNNNVINDNGKDRIIQINASLLDSYDDFIDYLRNDLGREEVGSDKINFSWDDNDLVLAKVTMIYQNRGFRGGMLNQDLFNTIDLKHKDGYKNGECVLNCFKYFGIELTDDDISSEDRYNIDTYSLIRLCEKYNITLYANKLNYKNVNRYFEDIKKDDNCMIFDTRTKYYYKNGKKLVPFIGRMIKDVDLILEKLDKLDKSDKIMICGENHVEPFESINEVIFSMNGLDIYTKNGDKVIRITQKKYDGDNIINHSDTKMERIYSFFDFETVIDLMHDTLPFKEYSLAYWTVSENELESISKMNFSNQDELLLYIKSKMQCNIYVGYDCTHKYLEYLRAMPNYDITLIGFNNSNFDNYFIIRELEKNYSDDKNDFDFDVFYNGNSIMNIKFFNNIEMFDLAKHLTQGKLFDYCESFKIKANKVSFDHIEAQNRFNNGKLFDNDFITELSRYNLFDVISTGLLFYAYKTVIENIIYFSVTINYKLKDINSTKKSIVNYKTIGSLMWEIMEKYWVVNKIKIPKFEMPELFKTNEEYQKAVYNLATYQRIRKRIDFGFCMCKYCIKKRERTKTYDVIKREKKLDNSEDIIKKSHDGFNNYTNIRQYISAGRCDLPDDIPHIINGDLMSLDVCSMYPYNMCVNKVYYPYGKIIKSEEYDENLFGYYWCDIDQSNLPPEKKFLCEKTCTQNIWNTKNILVDYFINTEKIKYLKKLGCNVTIRDGIKFTEKIASYELFKPLLSLMKLKNEQDILKQNKSPECNSALRNVLKLMINSISGKVIEKLHTEKVEYIKHDQYDKKFLGRSETGDVLREVSIINGSDKYYLVQYKTSDVEEFKNHRPIFLADLIYTYSHIHLYDNLISLGALYRDTDSGKFPKKLGEEVIKILKERELPHWKETELYDERLKYAKIYNNDFKVFGSLEDELQEYNGIKISYFNKKKEYCMITKKGKVIMKGKGIKMSNLPLNEEKLLELGVSKEIIKEYNIDKIKNALEKNINEKSILEYHNIYNKYLNEERDWESVFYDLVVNKKPIFLLTNQFKKIVRNTKKNVKPCELYKMNVNANTIRMSYIVKCITPNNNPTKIY